MTEIETDRVTRIHNRREKGAMVDVAGVGAFDTPASFYDTLAAFCAARDAGEKTLQIDTTPEADQ